MVKKFIKITFIFLITFLLATQVNAAIGIKEMKERYQKDPNVINTLTEKEVKEWQNELKAYCKNLGSVTGDVATIPPNNAISNSDRNMLNKMSNKLVQRKQDIQKEKDKKENNKKTDEEKKKEDEKLKKYNIKEITKYLIEHGPDNLSDDVKKQWEKTIKESNESDAYKKQAQDLLDGASMEDINGTVAGGSDTAVYKQPKKGDTKTAATSLGDLIEDGDSLIRDGKELQYDEAGLQKFSTIMYNVLLAIAVAIALIVGVIVGIKYMTGSVEEKANYKAMLLPYVAGCVVVFGSFGIWKVVVTILQNI